MSDRVAVFDKGEIQQIDPAETLYEAPVNSFVAGFIGESNAISGTIRHVDGDFCQARLIGGGSVSAARCACARPASRPRLSIRPERVMLGERAAGLRQPLDATIAEIHLSGRPPAPAPGLCGGSGGLWSRCRCRRLTRPQPTVGNRLSIGWRAEDCALDR